MGHFKGQVCLSKKSKPVSTGSECFHREEILVLGWERHSKKLRLWFGCSQTIMKQREVRLILVEFPHARSVSPKHNWLHRWKTVYSRSRSSRRRTKSKLISPQQGQAYTRCHHSPGDKKSTCWEVHQHLHHSLGMQPFLDEREPKPEQGWQKLSLSTTGPHFHSG